MITVDMPYPLDNTTTFVTATEFRRNDLSSDQATRVEAPASRETLPGFTALQTTIERHDAELTDVRWSINFACRTLGGIAAPADDAVASVKNR